MAGKEDYLVGEITPAYRYITFSINNFLKEGIILDGEIRNNLYVVSQNQNLANSMLDSVGISDDILPMLGSQKEEMKLRVSIQDDMAIVIKYAENLEQYYPIIIKGLENHENNIKSSTQGYCKSWPFKK